MTVVTSMESPSCCVSSRSSSQGWKAIRLSNGLVELHLVPEIGGRVIQLTLGAQEFFYVNRRHAGRIYPAEENCLASGWKNYGGSKVWPIPQGWSSDAEWAGTPDPILDGGAYTSEVVDDQGETAAIHLEGPPDEYTGLTFGREIRIIFQHSSRVSVRHTMRNTSARSVRWGLWRVTQQKARPGLSVLAPAESHRKMSGDQDNAIVSLDVKSISCGSTTSIKWPSLP